MLIKCTKKTVLVTLCVMSLGLTLVAVVFRGIQHCPPCSTCTTMSPDGKILPSTPCPCTSYPYYLYQRAFGHRERQSETMTKSKAPCEVKSGPH